MAEELYNDKVAQSNELKKIHTEHKNTINRNVLGEKTLKILFKNF